MELHFDFLLSLKMENKKMKNGCMNFHVPFFIVYFFLALKILHGAIFSIQVTA